VITRHIPSTGEQLPVIGLGTWNVFDVTAPQAFPSLTQVLRNMRHAGARIIDSSPMYGHAEGNVGRLTADAGCSDHFFYATKVWTSGKKEGIRQMESSFAKMKRQTMDLMQIHNLLDWQTHLETLRDWKAEGRIRYIGITHYTDGMHAELEKVMRAEAVDFVQFNYSVFNRHAEKRLLEAAADLGVATLINRPFVEGTMFASVKGVPLPGWAIEHGIASWSAFFLLYIVSHPAVTAVIPATGNPQHALENVQALRLALPEQAFRAKMAAFIDGLK
jgi:diketogulonate reductase-like aldo/keto reductase